MSAPIRNIKVGTVSLAIFVNNFEGKDTFSYTISKSYKDKKTNEWKKTNTFKSSEAIFLQLALQKAVEFTYLKDDTTKAETNPPQEDEGI